MRRGWVAIRSSGAAADLGAKLSKDITSSVEITQPMRFQALAQAHEYKHHLATDAGYEGGFDSNVRWVDQKVQRTC